MEQLNFFETPAITSTGVIINENKGVDLADLYFGTKERPNFCFAKGTYTIYPTGETHPLGHREKSLSGNYFPFIVSKKGNVKKILKPMCRPAFEYPIIHLLGNPEICAERDVMILFHKIVGRAFFKLPNGLHWKTADRKWVFHHKDSRTWDYRLSNLDLITQKENCKGRKKMDDETAFEQAKIKGLF